MRVDFREHRKQRAMTQLELAQHLGVRQSCVSMWESNHRTPSIPVLMKIADVLKTDIGSLISVDTGPQASTHGRQSQRLSDGEPVRV